MSLCSGSAVCYAKPPKERVVEADRCCACVGDDRNQVLCYLTQKDVFLCLLYLSDAQ